MYTGEGSICQNCCLYIRIDSGYVGGYIMKVFISWSGYRSLPYSAKILALR